MRIVVWSFVIKRKTTVRVVSLFRRFVLDSQEGVDEAGTAGLTIGVGKNCAVDCAT